MSKKIIILAACYQDVPVILYLIDKYTFKENINIYSQNLNLIKFMRYLNNLFWEKKIKIFYIEIFNKEYNNKNYFIMKFIRFINNIILERKLLKKLFDKYFKGKRNYKIYFFHRKEITYYMYFIKKLSSINKIYLLDINPIIQNGEKIKFRDYNFKSLIWNFRNRYMFSKDIELNSDGTGIFPYMSENYVSKYINYILDFKKIKNDVNKIYFKNFSQTFEKYKLIFFDQIFDKNEVIQAEIECLYRRIIELFNKYFGDNYAVKGHPDIYPFSNCITIFNYAKPKNIIEEYIPGEFCYNKNTKYYISFKSNVIMDGHYYCDKNKVRILLYNLLPNENDLNKSAMTKIFKSKIEGEVLFPKSFIELESIFKKYENDK